MIDEIKKTEIEKSLENLNEQDKKSILNCRLLNSKNKKKKMIKERGVFSIVLLSSVIAMLGGGVVGIASAGYKDKVNDIVEKSQYSLYNAQHKFDEEKNCLNIRE